MAGRSSAGQRKNLVGFEIDGVSYAVDIQRVREIIRPVPTLAIPSDGLRLPGLIGVADHRGHVVPVIELRARFGTRSQVPVLPREHGRDRDARWLIVALQGHLVGLVVDHVTEVFGAEQPASRDVSHLSRPDMAALIRAAYRHRGALVFVLDVDLLVAESDLGAVSLAQPTRPVDA